MCNIKTVQMPFENIAKYVLSSWFHYVLIHQISEPKTHIRLLIIY